MAETEFTEEWRAVPGYEGYYEASDSGKFRSLPRRVECSGTTRAYPGKAVPAVNGCVRFSKNRKRSEIPAHKITSLTFPEICQKPDPIEHQALDGEEWRDISGFVGAYQISSLGRVRSLRRIVLDNMGRERIVKSKILHRNKRKDGRTKVQLSNNGVDKTYIVSHLVAGAFLGHVKDGKKDIDHIDRNRANDCALNLRIATRAQNLWNASIKSTNTSGIKGVSWNKASCKWVAYICHNGKQCCLGSFTDIESAKIARLDAEKKYHGEFAVKCNDADRVSGGENYRLGRR